MSLDIQCEFNGAFYQQMMLPDDGVQIDKKQGFLLPRLLSNRMQE
jgi:hypothetical protein